MKKILLSGISFFLILSVSCTNTKNQNRTTASIDSCRLDTMEIGDINFVASTKSIPQISSSGYVYLEQVEKILVSQEIPCEDKLNKLINLSQKIDVQHLDDLIMLTYVKENISTFITKPDLRALLASTMLRRPIIGSTFCPTMVPKCPMTASSAILLSNSLIKKEVELISAEGLDNVFEYSKLSSARKVHFVRAMVDHMEVLLKDKALMASEAESFARSCDEKVSKIFGVSPVHCTVSGYGIHPRGDQFADGKSYVLGGYDSAWDGRWHCYADKNSSYNFDAQIKLPVGGGDTRSSLGCYQGQTFKISIAHERRVNGKILFGGPGGGRLEKGDVLGDKGKGTRLHTHLELLLMPFTPRGNKEYDYWWQEQRKIDPVNLFCRGGCGF